MFLVPGPSKFVDGPVRLYKNIFVIFFLSIMKILILHSSIFLWCIVQRVVRTEKCQCCVCSC